MVRLSLSESCYASVPGVGAATAWQGDAPEWNEACYGPGFLLQATSSVLPLNSLSGEAAKGTEASWIGTVRWLTVAGA